MTHQIAWKRVVLVVASTIVSSVAFIWGRPLTVENPEAVRILVTTFSIFSGIIIALTTVAGDPVFLYGRNWRVASEQRNHLTRRMMRYQLLFYVYLVVLALAYASALLQQVPSEQVKSVSQLCERIALSLGAGALVLSFGLPSIIINAHRERLGERVEELRKSTRSVLDPERRSKESPSFE